MPHNGSGYSPYNSVFRDVFGYHGAGRYNCPVSNSYAGQHLSLIHI